MTLLSKVMANITCENSEPHCPRYMRLASSSPLSLALGPERQLLWSTAASVLCAPSEGLPREDSIPQHTGPMIPTQSPPTSPETSVSCDAAVASSLKYKIKTKVPIVGTKLIWKFKPCGFRPFIAASTPFRDLWLPPSGNSAFHGSDFQLRGGRVESQGFIHLESLNCITAQNKEPKNSPKLFTKKSYFCLYTWAWHDNLFSWFGKKVINMWQLKKVPWSNYLVLRTNCDMKGVGPTLNAG